ncbi:MAG: hypothetical protein U1F33_08310 [Alphaproteobacteria bacterium]
MLTGFVDDIRPDRIVGWAADLDSPDARVELALIVDDEEIGRVVADHTRDDLKRLGRYGDGRHGFSFAIPPGLSTTDDHDVVVRFVRDEQVLAKFKFCRRAPSATPDRTSAPLRYILHIGQPKTGTKYLQQSFNRFRRQLLDDGICYPTEWWTPTSVFGHHELVGEIEGAPNAKLEKAFAELNAAGHRVVLLSCEGFCENSKAGLEYLRKLTAGNPVEVVYYARRWSDLIPSQWQQSVKQGASETLPEFYANTLARAENSQIINQSIVLDRYASVFGRESLRVISYSNLQDSRLDIAADFFRNVLGWTHDLILRQELVHESMGIQQTELIRCFNVLESFPNDKSEAAVYNAFRVVQQDPAVGEDVRHVFAAMQKHVGEIRIDDDAYPLRPVFSRMNEAYGDRLANPMHGREFFKKRSRSVSFVKPDFLLEDGIVVALKRVHGAVLGHLAGSKSRMAS